MTTWELLLMGARVKELYKEGLINVSFDGILLRKEAFDKMFPVGWAEEPYTDSDGKNMVFRSIKIDGQKFTCVRYGVGG